MRPIFNDPAIQAEFEDKGYVVVDFLTAKELSTLKEAYKSSRDQPIQMGFSTSNMSMDTNYRRKASDTVTISFNRAMNHYFDRCKIFFGIFTSKQPGQEKSLCPMHQDPAYVDENNYTGLTIWVPLIDVDETNGALEVIDRSHLLNGWPRSTLPRFPYNDLVPLLLKKYFKRINMKAGQAYLGSSRIFHWSPPNLSNTERVAALAWMAEEESTMRCYYQDYQNPGETMEVFELEPSHYIEKPLFSRPDESKAVKIGIIPYKYEVLDEIKIDALIHYA
ncbi:Ectoine hydroxylase-related dioxygenase, phytanoyl-CoA dioxygenase (PhyH) family [Mucilaginibacter mallensis]|uniref:Ectoine hydroxylase-related dioxygenase, phytanoyl-CoA dioxygenase (PhyH) family n=1 Tax=Mucilaginibacter mallensis TaxID=652787 RepID=A0A1H1WPM7_MUCMA|nr:phytanoyl-CoA dioxygenase family protein [Mucilaginibacter mallensis]SDS99217.1 Ectoine hydroxylase-related dioxygenase, phytanoyl-CoA dioxygenase (PhyH) family [Mucilaginibacter mallensis]